MEVPAATSAAAKNKKLVENILHRNIVGMSKSYKIILLLSLTYIIKPPVKNEKCSENA